MKRGNTDERRVLVVGGGIGGITAALELASCGVRVTLLEEGPSIGGRMTQLDKTFPTLDCSTCTLSPKMVEVALQKNITLLSQARPTAIDREGRGFVATVLQKARYVDMEKCTGCGSCFDGCPVVMKSEFNMGTGMRKAINIPFPQAVPNKATIDLRGQRPCRAACMDACPVRTNVPGYLKAIAGGRFEEAYLLIRETNPFPSVCGRTCYAPCERACNRGQIDDPVAIRDLKRAAADRYDVRWLEPPRVRRTGKKVAVVGSGPASLTCAHDLALLGHDVTLFDVNSEPGGMLRYAVPEYRLPARELDREIGIILRLGVEARCGVDAGRALAPDVLRRNHDAIFVGTGTLGAVPLGIEGEDQGGVMDSLSFLKQTSKGGGGAAIEGARVAVLGSGSTAVDCARTRKGSAPGPSCSSPARGGRA
jgi:NADPH-dependent glutamate synthase beta subunit-like oxidoreductase/NAD-dependent dihydropyrimidine dehydrogenase PreA subunit